MTGNAHARAMFLFRFQNRNLTEPHAAVGVASGREQGDREGGRGAALKEDVDAS